MNCIFRGKCDDDGHIRVVFHDGYRPTNGDWEPQYALPIAFNALSQWTSWS